MTSLVVGWLSRACTVAKRCILGYSYYQTLIGNPTLGIQWYNFRPPGVTPNRGMGPPWGAFCQITLTSCCSYCAELGLALCFSVSSLNVYIFVGFDSAKVNTMSDWMRVNVWPSDWVATFSLSFITFYITFVIILCYTVHPSANTGYHITHCRPTLYTWSWRHDMLRVFLIKLWSTFRETTVNKK